MSSYFDDASLVMIPSGYKTSKVYSVKPTDGSGDLTFSRSNDTATRVNSAGLIEKVRTNRVLYSNTFTNAAWIQFYSGVTAGQQDPFGGTSGTRFLTSSTGGYMYQNSVCVTGVEMTASVWVKSNTGSSQNFQITANAGSESSPSITATTSWQRVSWTFTSSSNGTILFGFNASSIIDVLIYGFQLETGVMTDYIATTSAAVSVGPVANVPRLDYLNSSCPRLLLEPQRTNKITYSENQGPTGTNWYPSTTWTVTNNAVVSPSGYQDADTLTETTSTGFHSGYFNATIESSYTGTYTISAFAKYNGRIFVLNPYPTGAGRTYFDLQNGTVLQAGTGVTAKIENYGNGWYRCICTASFSSEIVAFEHMLASAVGTLQYTGNGTSGVHIWGCMAEAGAYATSYIPTLGAAVTRGADACSKTGISSLIGQTEGTLFVEFDLTNANAEVGQIAQLGTGSERVYIFKNLANSNVYQLATQSASGYNFVDTSAITTSTVKIAIAYKSGQNAFYVNGTLISTASATANPTSLSQFDLTNASLATSVKINQALLFKTRLSNSELASLTTL